MLLSRGIELENANLRLLLVVVDNSHLISTLPSSVVDNTCLISTLPSSTGAEVQLLETHSADMHAAQPTRATGLQ